MQTMQRGIMAVVPGAHPPRLKSNFLSISTQKALPFGTVQQVKDDVRRLLEQVGKNGGYIAAPAHDIPGDAKPENLAAMLDALNSQ